MSYIKLFPGKEKYSNVENNFCSYLFILVDNKHKPNCLLHSIIKRLHPVYDVAVSCT